MFSQARVPPNPAIVTAQVAIPRCSSQLRTATALALARQDLREAESPASRSSVVSPLSAGISPLGGSESARVSRGVPPISRLTGRSRRDPRDVRKSSADFQPSRRIRLR